MRITDRDVRLAKLLAQPEDLIHKAERDMKKIHGISPHKNAKLYRLYGKDLTIRQLCEKAPFKIGISGMQGRLNMGMTPHEAVTIADARAWKREAREQQA